jgi:hypothetical protein
MDKFLASFFTLKGDNVDMNVIEMLIYGTIPVFGQLLMRVDKFGGSLDKPYLFFPLLFIPPFSFIPVLVAKFGFLKKIKGSNILDIYILIPIIFRFILIFIMAQIGSPGGLTLQAALIFGAIIITNIIHALTQDRCKDIKSDIGNHLVKGIADSMVQYAGAMVVLFSTAFIPIIGEILEVLRNVELPFVGNISHFIDSSIWSVGLVCGYMFINMIDANYNTDADICTGKIGALRIIISIIAFAITIFYQIRSQIASMI